MAKGRQVESNEDRTAEYRDWRHQFDGGCYVTDVDQVEWRVENGKMVPKAVIELTRIDNLTRPENVLAAILGRIKDKPQGILLNMVAEALGVKAYIVVIVRSLSVFFVYCLTGNYDRWAKCSKGTYENWIRSL